MRSLVRANKKEQDDEQFNCGYLRAKNERKSDPAWLERAWGAAPDFPDRPQQQPLFEMQRL